MDNLSLRRALYEDPASMTTEKLKHDPQLIQLQQELMALDNSLREQLQVEVPTQLAEQILLQQRMLPQERSWFRRTMPYASAASVLIAVLFWQSPSGVTTDDFGQSALSHVYHELAALRATAAVPLSDIQPLFAQIGIRADLPVPVHYARFCDFEGVRSLHLVLEMHGQIFTLFVVPDDLKQVQGAPAQFADARFFGQTFTAPRHRLVLVAEQPQLLAAAGDMLTNALKYNI